MAKEMKEQVKKAEEKVEKAVEKLEKKLEEGIHIHHPYAFATSDSQKSGAAFMKIKNHGPADRVINAKADVSETIELHTHEMDGDKMMMRKVEAYDVPKHGHVMLDPMGHHVMFIGLNAPLKEGDTFPLTLVFEKAGEITVDVSVVAPGTKPDAMTHKKHEHGHKHGDKDHSHAHDHHGDHNHDHTKHSE